MGTFKSFWLCYAKLALRGNLDSVQEAVDFIYNFVEVIYFCLNKSKAMLPSSFE